MQFIRWSRSLVSHSLSTLWASDPGLNQSLLLWLVSSRGSWAHLWSGQSRWSVTWCITNTHFSFNTSASPLQVCALHHKCFVMDGIHSHLPSSQLQLTVIFYPPFATFQGSNSLVFFWITDPHFFSSHNLRMSVSADSRDLHSVFFNGFKSSHKTFDFHGIRARNLAAPYYLEVHNLLILHI